MKASAKSLLARVEKMDAATQNEVADEFEKLAAMIRAKDWTGARNLVAGDVANPLADFIRSSASTEIAPSARAIVETPKKYLNSPAAKQGEPMTVLFYFPDQNTSASCEIDASVFDAIKAGAAREEISIGEFICRAVAVHNPPKKHAKNFVMMDLDSGEQAELRALVKSVHGTGSLHGVLKCGALRDIKARLRQDAELVRITGMKLPDAYRLFGNCGRG